MGLCAMVFLLTIALLTPAVLLMIGHGVVSAGLFFSVGSLYERTHTRDLNLLSSGAAVLPKLGFFFLLFILGNIAFPGTVNFIAEFAIFKGLLDYDPLAVMILMPSYLANAASNIWLATRVLYGAASRLKSIIHPEDLTFRELVIVRNLSIFMIGTGTLFANPIISQIEQGLLMALAPYTSSGTDFYGLWWTPAPIVIDIHCISVEHNINYKDFLRPAMIAEYSGIFSINRSAYSYMVDALGYSTITAHLMPLLNTYFECGMYEYHHVNQPWSRDYTYYVPYKTVDTYGYYNYYSTYPGYPNGKRIFAAVEPYTASFRLKPFLDLY
jgi:NADH:ubiquinone oxidoreductase subunit 5 (subunit L)/multisubunit Na+/H+ antiporter MnhA subunit